MGTNPSEFKGKDLPVENVTWYEAILFCNARSESEGLQKVYQIEGNKIIWDKKANGYRLPTEADRKSTRLNSSHRSLSRMPSSA